MKKITSSILLIAFSTLVLISCSKNSVTTPQKNEVLLEKLSKFNNSQVRPEGFWDDLGKAIAATMVVAGADIVGGAAGANAVAPVATTLSAANPIAGASVIVGGTVICGAGASIAAGVTLVKNAQDIKKPASRYSGNHYDLPTVFQHLAGVGIDHNFVVHNYGIDNLSYDSYLGSLNLGEEQRNYLNSESMKNIYDNVKSISIDYVANSMTFAQYTSKMLEAGLITLNTKSVLDMFMETYSTVTDLNQIKPIVEYYVAAVNESNLDNTDKQSIIAGLMIASESPYYWYK